MIFGNENKGPFSFLYMIYSGFISLHFQNRWSIAKFIYASLANLLGLKIT